LRVLPDGILFIGGLELSEKKIKVLTMSDHPLLPSGVGTQTKYVIEALLKTGRYEVISLGGAIHHPNYQPMRTKEWEDLWTIYPVNGYGDTNLLRQFITIHKPDIVYFMTDPRFYEWLYNMDDEIRANVPLVYYHVWDNYPYPKFNKQWYDSCDVIATISKVTSDIVQTVAPDVEEHYIPHAVDPKFFAPKTSPQEMNIVQQIRSQNLQGKEKVIFFWNNRNARRKQSGTLLFWFKEFLDKVGQDKACLLMHTDVDDPHGQPLEQIASELGLMNGQVLFSKNKLPPEQMALMYDMADCTVNISDAEGFGLATLESLSTGTPIIVAMTGGLQEQVTNGKDSFGVGIEPASKSVIGSPQCPYIYEDRISKEDFIKALTTIYEMTPEERKELGARGRQHVIDNYNFENFEKQWVELMDNIHENHGSWENRKNYTIWECKEL
jgi:glycosyltransferase involved in cell wall biosynthesis